MTLNLHNFDEVRLKGEAFYKTLKHVHCPYFKDNVFFNAHGLEHLKFKRQRQSRSRQDQYMRFKLLHLAPVILEKSGTLQGIWETRSFEKVRIHNRTDILLKNVEYYEFIAIIENVRVKIIIKKIENGQLLFWSLIPYWGMYKHTRKKKLHSGHPEHD